MALLRSVLVALACSVPFVAGQPLGGDDPIVQKIIDIIGSANDYFTDHLLTTVSLPNIGMLLDPVKLTEGKLSQFDTIQLAGAPIVNQQQNADGSTTYTFDIDLTLNVLLVQYQFHASILGLLSVDGQVSLSPQKHTLNTQGVVVVGPGSNCDARMSSAKVTQFQDYQVDIEPNDIPFIGKVTETVLNFVSPKLLGVVDSVINASLLLPSYQKNFSDLVCTVIKPN